ncbi:helix-turn-helix domain-containing protein [Azospirillum sp. TSA2s]|uniref:helix-turn-helix domain-containing protein n=1 Tax=Azospirillum sp. TSA2s TaxID=709810 RepID=UPI003527FB4C
MATEYLSEESVAEFFDTSRGTVRRWVERGVLPAPSLIGGLKRWHIDSLRYAARSGLDEAAEKPRRRSADPDEIAARLLRDGPQNRNENSRRRNGKNLQLRPQ